MALINQSIWMDHLLRALLLLQLILQSTLQQDRAYSSVTMLTSVCGASTGGSAQEVLHIIERAAAEQRNSSQVVSPAVKCAKKCD